MKKTRQENRAVRRAARRKPAYEAQPQAPEQTYEIRPARRPRITEIEHLTDAQARYDGAIAKQQIIFGVGPAGTGKTWLPAMRAAMALDEGKIERIFVTRPAVEAGENLGFMPGDMQEKYDHYLEPVYDALMDYFGKGKLEYLIKAQVIVPRPLAFMRGLTLKNSWAILDEAQNTTVTQMKMFLSRIGNNTKFIITGDPRQKDISGPSGLVDALDRFRGKAGFAECRFGIDDVVRSGICMTVIRGYESDPS